MHLTLSPRTASERNKNISGKCFLMLKSSSQIYWFWFVKLFASSHHRASVSSQLCPSPSISISSTPNKFSFAFECKFMREREKKSGTEGDNLIYWKCISIKIYSSSMWSILLSFTVFISTKLCCCCKITDSFFLSFSFVCLLHMELFVMIKF